MAVVERVEAAPGERRRLRLANPATLEPLGELEVDSAEQVRAAVERARKAQTEWAAASFRERAHYLDRAALGLPAGVFNLVQGDGETGAALLEAGVDKIAFTGSVATGRRVAEVCGRAFVPCTLELGGKDPMIVCEDADLERASRGAVYGAFCNAGQVCTSTERVYVVERVADEFTRRVVDRTSELRQGTEGEFDVGPMIRSEQLAVVEEHIRDAIAKGARVLAGGRRNPAYV